MAVMCLVTVELERPVSKHTALCANETAAPRQGGLKGLFFK